MSDAYWQHGDVTRFDRHLVAVRPAEHETRRAGSKAENFVGGGVIVMEGVDAVAPPRGPPGPLEDGLVGRCGIVSRRADDAAINKHRRYSASSRSAPVAESRASTDPFVTAGTLSQIVQRREKIRPISNLNL